MGVNRVDYAGETIIDISDSTVDENNLLQGAKAYGADGEPVEGAVITHNVIDNLESTSSQDALSAQMGKKLNDEKDAKAVELTKAEYDALPNSKYTDGIKYIITDWHEDGGGSTVAWTQTVTSGTKIADININGTSQDVFVPTPDTLVTLTQAQYDALPSSKTSDNKYYFIIEE